MTNKYLEKIASKREYHSPRVKGDEAFLRHAQPYDANHPIEEELNKRVMRSPRKNSTHQALVVLANREHSGVRAAKESEKLRSGRLAKVEAGNSKITKVIRLLKKKF